MNKIFHLLYLIQFITNIKCQSSFETILKPIGNGQPAVYGQFPYQARLSVIEADGRSGLCGGCLISRKWILTAGHCLLDKVRVKIFLGTLFLKNDVPEAGRIEMESTNFKIYSKAMTPDGKPNYRYDMGAVELQRAVKFTKNIQPISLPSSSIGNLVGVSAIVSGWGKTENGEDAPRSEILLYARMKIRKLELCNKVFKKEYSNHNLCATGETDGGSCRGDSGGPLTWINNGHAILIGVISFGSVKKCTVKNPRGFARVSEFLEWIEENTGVIP